MCRNLTDIEVKCGSQMRPFRLIQKGVAGIKYFFWSNETMSFTESENGNYALEKPPN